MKKMQLFFIGLLILAHGGYSRAQDFSQASKTIGVTNSKFKELRSDLFLRFIRRVPSLDKRFSMALNLVDTFSIESNALKLELVGIVNKLSQLPNPSIRDLRERYPKNQYPYLYEGTLEDKIVAAAKELHASF